MKRNWWYRFIFLILATVISIVVVVPTVFDYEEGTKYPVQSKINLGLDLQGGLYMILGIDFNKVYRDEVKSWARKVEFYLKDEGIKASIGELDATDIEDPKHSVKLDNPADTEKAYELVKKYFSRVVRLTHKESGVLEYGLNETFRAEIQTKSVTKSIEVIRNRIDEFGVSEPEIVSQGNDRIVVQLPGVRDIDRAKELIGKTAKLEFKLVHDKVGGAIVQGWLQKAESNGIKFDQGKERFSEYLLRLNTYIRKEFKGQIPEKYEIAFKKEVSKATNKITNMTPFIVESTPRLTGDDLADASVQINQRENQPYVSLEFKASGAKRFEQVTAENTGRLLAVVLDGNVYTAPRIQGRIAGGNAQITLGTGNYSQTLKEASDISLVLRAGALPVQLDFLEQRIVGPSLGHDSIEKARIASIIGCVTLFLFILVYYKFSGAIAAVTLTLNVLFVLAILVGLEATLTLPGIAGIALTLGMAIDANIIIYERIREECKKGLSNYKAVESGFAQAFWTIIDANITTGLAGLCLLNFGTGPIKGFAVTLLIGIVSTIYTAYFVSKLLFEFYMNKVEGQDLSI
ncbi:MAG: protein translocase subunit SecD [Bacteriovoracaceae bacterium]|nr:protein translocase subunit SecD [Bacteriovoracaceae bacterium]